jgi:UDP-GlcNAc3NAcA epimerase
MKIVTVIGARPQIIKASALSCIISKMGATHIDGPVPPREVIVHTGQHYDAMMSDVFFDELGMPAPEHHLGVGSASHGDQTGQMLAKVEAVLKCESPDIVLVYGDTNSTLAGALAASKLNLPVAHVEAGLRSFNRGMPEEINRVLTDHISDVLFCPSDEAVRNLQREGIDRNVHNVGDVMYDCHLTFSERARGRSHVLEDLGLAEGAREYCLATIHRAENTDDSLRLRQIIDALNQLDLEVVLPLHPRTKAAIEAADLQLSNVRILEPVSFLDMLVLKMNAAVILTDSGGLQKEAYFCGVPCVTLRDETEWRETTQSGMNIVAGADTNRILAAYESLRGVDHPESASLYGDGRAAERILRILEEEFRCRFRHSGQYRKSADTDSR